MNLRRNFSIVVLVVLLLSSCQTTNLKQEVPTGQEPIRTNPVDVQTSFINQQAISPQALDIASGNLFSNGGFESGLDGWTACSDGAIKTSGDAFEGSGALEVIPNNCFYRSAEVSSGQDLILSCYAKIRGGSGWTGMGLGFADSTWSTVGEAPATVITGTDYARYDVAFTAPANSKYASMWFYSDNPVVVDNCSLMLEATPPPPPPSGNNLLENGDFETASVEDGFANWSKGCDGFLGITGLGDGRQAVTLREGACLDQSLSASDISVLKGQEFVYSCIVKLTNSSYSSISIFFDGVPISKVMPTLKNDIVVELRGVAPTEISNGFVSLYTDIGGRFIVDDCSLTVENTQPVDTCVDPVNIPDSVLNNIIRDALGADQTSSITCVDMESLTELVSADRNNVSVATLEGLQYAKNLSSLVLSGYELEDISIIGQLSNLESLTLIANNIFNLTPLESLTNLTYLVLTDNEITDIESLSGLVGLEFLMLGSNNISDVSPLENLVMLYDLNLIRNKITTITPLANNQGLNAGDRILIRINCLDLSESSQASQDLRTLRSRTVGVDSRNQNNCDTPTVTNLLENGTFETVNANSKPVNWNKGCGGSYDRVVGRSGNGLSLTGGACVDQALSSSDLSTLANKQYTYSCYAKNTGGYASMSIFFDDVPVATVIPQSNDFQLVEVTGVAPSAGSGFVSIYSEAGLTVDDCSVNASSTIDVVIIEPITTIVDPSNPSTDSVSRFGRGHDIEGTTIAVGDTPNGDFYVYELINGQWVKTFVDEELQTNGSTYIAISEDESIIIVAGFLRSSNTGTNDVIYQKNSQGVWEKVKVLDESAVTNVSIGNDLITTGGSLWGRNEGGANNWGLIRSFGSNVAHLNENTLVTYQSAGLSIYEKDAGGINNWGQVAQIPLDFQARDVILTQNSLAVLDFNSPRVEIYDRVNSMSWEKSGEIQLLTPSTSSLSFDFDENVLVLPQDDKVYIYEKNTSNGIWENIARTTSQSIVRNVALDCSTVTYSLEENTGSSLNLVDIPRSTPCP